MAPDLVEHPDPGMTASGSAEVPRSQTLGTTAADDRVAALEVELANLRIALEQRAVIEQAKGVIMGSLHCGPDAAFRVLVAQSQSENRKLRDVAAEITARQDRHPSEACLTPASGSSSTLPSGSPPGAASSG